MPYIACNAKNYQQGRSMPIEYIVVHYTAGGGDTARGNANYFANNAVKTSAHYFVDGKEYVQSVPEDDTAWHCGGGLQGKNGHSFYKKCMNSNSIGVEICSKYNGNYDADRKANNLKFEKFYFKEQALKNAADLIKNIMLRRNIPITKVIRHYDVTGKICPAPMISESEWKRFKQMIEGKDEFKMFPDVKDDDYGYKHIKKLKEYGIVNGDENGNFNPDEKVTRRDAAIIAANVLTAVGK